MHIPAHGPRSQPSVTLLITGSFLWLFWGWGEDEARAKREAANRLVFQAFFPGRRVKGLLKGPPTRLVIRAEVSPLTVLFIDQYRATPAGALRIVPAVMFLSLCVDGTTVDLGPEASFQFLFSPRNDYGGGAVTGVVGDLKPAALLALIRAGSVDGTALGIPIKLSTADQAAVAEFADQIGLSGRERPDR